MAVYEYEIIDTDTAYSSGIIDVHNRALQAASYDYLKFVAKTPAADHDW